MAAARRIASAALLVCTYRRPESFAKLIETAAALEIPEGLAFALVVADNNPKPAWEAYVRTAVAGLPWPVHYGHEPVAGYSSARNKALTLALEHTAAEVFLFVDDDMLLDPQWLVQHLRSHVELEADVVNGRIYGVRERFAHGARLEKCGAGNVSFNRRLVAGCVVGIGRPNEKPGLGLQFDPAFNTLGMEDQAFFRAATAQGVVIKQSDWPLIYNYYGAAAVPDDEIINKMHTTGAMHHNEVALARQQKGLVPAALMASKGVLFGVKGMANRLESRMWSALGKADKARRSELSAQKELLKMRGRFAGLSGETVARQDVRRADPGEGQQRGG